MHGSRATRVPVGDRAVVTRLDDPPRRLVAEDEGERPDACQRGRRPRVVREEMEVAAADPPGRDGDAGPVLAGQLGLGQLGQRAGNSGSTMSKTTARTVASVRPTLGTCRRR